MTVADIMQTGHRTLGVRVIFKAGRKGIYFRSVKAEPHVHAATFFKTPWKTTRAKGYEYLTFCPYNSQSVSFTLPHTRCR